MASIASTAVKFWTYTLTNNILTIDETYNLTQISFELASGAATVIGSLNSGTVPSATIDLVSGNPITLASGNSNVITGITIDASAGVVVIVGKS